MAEKAGRGRDRNVVTNVHPPGNPSRDVFCGPLLSAHSVAGQGWFVMRA